MSIDKMTIEEINKLVIDAHNDHYINGNNKLIDTSKQASPNDNQIYHLYSDGQITHQKGAWAYMKRTEFNCVLDIKASKNIPFKFVKEADDGTTYAILTQQECLQFRELMNNYITKNQFV
jgi:hypothetical protein